MENTLFKNMGAGIQLFLLCFFSFSGLLIGAFFSGIVGSFLGVDFLNTTIDMQPLGYLRLSQAIMVIFWLLIPSILFIKLFYGKTEAYLKLDKWQTARYIIVAMLLVVAVQPLVGLLGYLNNSITFPESMSVIEAKFREMTSMNKSLVDRLMADTSIGGIIGNILILTIFAALFEEIFFRGCLQQLMCKLIKNQHVAIWLAAMVFSAIHLDFYGFIPRVFLGAMLGYLFVWSGTLWVPIIAHFFNNTLALIGQSYYYNTPEERKIQEIFESTDIWYIVISVALSAVLIYYLVKQKKGIQPEI